MIFRFAHCELDTGTYQLLRDGEVVHVEPQVFDLLVLLARNGTDLVSYDRLVAEIWGGRAVSDATISARISAARAAVGDSGKAQAVIRTISRRGVQLVVPVETHDAAVPVAEAQAPRVAEPHPVAGRQVIRYATSGDGVQIAYGISGEGPPLVRVGHWLTHLHLDWQSPIWRPMIERLGRTHTLYRYDQRGTGLSDSSFPGKGVDEFVDDLRAVVDATGAERVSIFTASQGSSVALKFAAEYPERVDRMVLYGGFAQGRYHRNGAEGRDEAKAFLSLVRSGWGKPGSPFMKFFTELFMPNGTPEQLANLIELQLASATPANAMKLRDVIDNFDVSDILDRVRGPLLLVHARGDQVHPLSESQLIARSVPGTELIVLDSDNHVPLPGDTNWEILMSEAERFLLSD
ncbi:MAG: alpha/beta hydrolase [Rhodobacteraceae bacterium]|nr:alpha/beta hydrolase [Paracoccaceae bacterium]